MIQEYVRKYLSKSPRSRRDLGDSDDLIGPEIVHIPHGFQMLALNQGSKQPNVKLALNYLRQRGLGEAALWKFRIGIASEDRFRRRVIIPSFDAEGCLNTYAARSLSKNQFRKYLIPDVERLSIIFNELNIDWKQELTLVEGPFDLVKCVGNATCLQGSALTEDHLLFWRIVINRTPVVLALDADATKKTVRIAKLLASYDVPVRLLSLGSHEDVGEMTQGEFLQARQAAKPWSDLDALRMIISAWGPASGSG